MNGADMVWAALSQGMPTTITGMVAELGGAGRGGGVARAAEALGVVPRTIQRRMVGEARAAGRPTKAAQERGQSVRGQALGSAALRRAHADRMQGKQVHTRAKGTVRISQNYWTGEVYSDTYGDFEPTKADDMWQAFVDGDKQEAFAAWAEGAFDSYGLASTGGVEWENGELDSLDISFT